MVRQLGRRVDMRESDIGGQHRLTNAGVTDKQRHLSHLPDGAQRPGVADVTVRRFAAGALACHDRGVDAVLWIVLGVLLAVAGLVFAVALAPVAVLPENQRKGIGSLLIQQGLELLSGRGEKIVIVVGHPGKVQIQVFVGPLAQVQGGKWAQLEGHVEHFYRASFGNHAGGTSQLKRMVLATRGLGLPR